MGWMHDTLEYFSKDPLFRQFNHKNLTFPMLYAWSENYVLVLSHDEVVHMKGSLINKMPGEIWEKFANLRLLFGYMYAQPGKKLIFMGGEIAQWNEWNCNVSLDWDLLEYESHEKFHNYMKFLNELYKNEPAFYEMDKSSEGFKWVEFNDEANSVVSFIRYAKDPKDYMVCVFNMTPVVRENYFVGVPEHRPYKEIMNSDSEIFWGSNLGNMGGFWSDNVEQSGMPCRLNLTLPPLSAMYFKPE